MRKVALILLVGILSFSLCACNSTSKENTQSETAVSSETDSNSSAPSSATSIVDSSESTDNNFAEFKDLISRYVKMLNLYTYDILKYDELIDGRYGIIKSSEYKTYSDFRNFIENTFVKEDAELLLKLNPIVYNAENKPLYLEIDNMFVIDTKMKPDGYDIWTDWNKFEVTDVEYKNDNECTIKTKMVSLEDKVVGQEDTDNFVMVSLPAKKENGFWKISYLKDQYDKNEALRNR